ncbi:CAP domain-containing protein [Enhygromyxa salina]|uniref:CAP domain-containing protein n=1 Tax=Enhygromyxa salina TaxID=215803 RepID=UPI00215943D6|nr:CAP domain-containing protein [Enhygromyxa salina]
MRGLITATSVLALSACYEGVEPDDWYLDSGFGDTLGDASGAEGADGMQDEGDPTTTGDPTSGDGDSTTGDGDGDPTTGDGDGDPTTGDGDGDPTTGDGDGDGGQTTGDGDGDGDPTTGDGDGDGDPTTGDGDGDSTTSGDGDGDLEPLPNNDYCDPVSSWNANWVDMELEVLELVNQARAQGGDCDSQGVFAPSGPLSWDPTLTCAARVHSKDMADNNFFDHTNLQGNGPGWRFDQAGYNGGGWGENIAAGYSDPASVVQGWLDSDGHCANMLNPSFSLIGIGYATGNGDWTHYWTQTFGG